MDAVRPEVTADAAYRRQGATADGAVALARLRRREPGQLTAPELLAS
ncbi:hypothetical protein ABT120_43940 [Nonomuraea angiospora]